MNTVEMVWANGEVEVTVKSSNSKQVARMLKYAANCIELETGESTRQTLDGNKEELDYFDVADPEDE